MSDGIALFRFGDASSAAADDASASSVKKTTMLRDA